jgi:hypothetical protein
MEKQISPGLKTIFLVHAVAIAILGLGFWITPSRFMLLVGWFPEFVILGENELQVPGNWLVDNAITRLLGAALLALAYSSFQGWRMSQWREVALVVQLEVAFSILGLVGLTWSIFRHWQTGHVVPVFGYILVALWVGLVVVWLWALRNHTKE